MTKKELVLELHNIGSVQFGNFTLKSGIQSPIYIDLRRIISYPPLLRAIAHELWQQIQHYQFDLICGVPYTALPIATVMSITNSKPMVMRRKEVKDHGTRQTIEGVFQAGQTCLVVEDLLTSGSSVLETIVPLEQAGLKIEHIAILVNRQQGGVSNIEKKRYFVHPVLTLSEIMTILCEQQIINQETVHAVHNYLAQHQTSI